MKRILNNFLIVLACLFLIAFILFCLFLLLFPFLLAGLEPEIVYIQSEPEIVEVEVIRYPTEYELQQHDTEIVWAIAKTVYGEARGCSTTEQAAVIWCILNRTDDERFPNDILEVVTQENQFDGYNENNPVTNEILSLVNDVLYRWELEQTAIGNVGRVLSKEYCWFYGNGTENIFRDSYNGNFNTWDWSLDSPYEG